MNDSKKELTFPQSMRSAAAIVFFIFICWIIFTADAGRVNPYLQQMRSFPYGDKVGHFTLYGILAFLVNLALNNKRVRIFSLHILAGALWVGTFAVLEEFTQIAFVTRNFELEDILCDLLGIGCFSYLAVRISRLIKNPEPAQSSI